MPNYYAHFRFGAMVLSALPRPLWRELNAARAAFDLGCLGPDPLYFYGPLRLKNPVRAEALGMHSRPGRVPLERLRRTMDGGGTQGRAAAAGFFCHYALDSACHGYVLQSTGHGGPSHAAVEVGFDRLLMREDGFRTPRLAGFPPVSGDFGVYRTNAAAYRLADGKALRSGYRAMSVYARALGRLYPALDGETALTLRRLLYAAAEPTAARLEDYLAGAALDGWYDRDFYGARAR